MLNPKHARLISLAAVMVCAVALAHGAADHGKPPPRFQAGVRTGKIESDAITEASGIAASRCNAGVLWVHNDSGDTARVFAMNTTGKLLGIYNLSGASATDWEDIAVGPGPVPGQHYIYAGDIGDNNAVRGTIAVYRVAEPEVTSTQQPVTVTLTGVEKFTLRYEDGSRDAETLMIDPKTGDLYIVSKRDTNSKVYRAAKAELTTSGAVTLHRVATLPWGFATGGDISPDGNEIIIKGYSNASLWRRPATGNLWDAFSGTAHAIPLASEPQGEAIGFDREGRGYYTTSEGVHQPIYYFARVSVQSSGN